MTKIIVITVTAGILFGFFLAPEALVAQADLLIMIGLSLLLFLVGMDMGKQEGLLESIRRCGAAIIMVPVMAAVGTLAGTALMGLVFGLALNEGAAIGAGFGWYSLAPIIIAGYSTELSAMSFMSNVFRELGTVILIPVVSARIGYFEAVSMGGAAAMDVLLPVVEKATEGRIAVYSFVSGAVLSIAVPVLVPLLIAL